MQYQLEQIGYDAILIRFINADNATLLPIIHSISQRLRERADIAPVVIDIIPSYQSILLNYHILKTSPHKLINQLNALIQPFLTPEGSQYLDNQENTLITLPICYHSSLAPDLIHLSQYTGLAVEDIIQIHSTTLYCCYAIGFMPHFAYLGDVDKRIQIPRHAKPRAKVVAGSVGIADNQTAIYPKESPGGWQIIGQSPAALNTISVGCRVQFNVISLTEFKHLNSGE